MTHRVVIDGGPLSIHDVTEVSERRAEVVVNYLVEQGMNADRLNPVGYGETEPVTEDDTEEALSARLAAGRAQPDDLVVLEALRKEQATLAPEESRDLFDLDHKFHQAVAAAAHNKYLAQTLDRLFGLSRRLWYLVLPYLESLPSSVEMHLDLVEAVESRDADRAEEIMRGHVKGFYDEVREILIAREREA